MPDRTIVTLVPRDTTPVRPLVESAEPALAPVVRLPVSMYGNRVIHPVNAAPGTRLAAPNRATAGSNATGQNPGPLARALLAMPAGDLR